MKDPEKFGATEAAKENIDDMIVGARGNPQKLHILLRFFEEMIHIAEPFSNAVTGEIRSPKGRLPIEKLPREIRQSINRMDNAFLETMSFTQWMQVFREGLERVRRKLGAGGDVSDGGERLR
ncbi:MAG: hypothetical protein PHE68_04620 [Candidatus Peribacteraceae bacterium]|nr:hypothetical protein [Candidatus Peribacteraceae bacterium]